MKRIIFFVLFISLTLEQAMIKRSQRSKHGEDCISDSACEEGFICKINRCYTKYESENLKSLGLLEKNLCSFKKRCPSNQKCFKHRCIDKDTPLETRKNKTGNIENIHLLFTGGIFLNKKPYLSGFRPDNTINYDHLFSHLSNYIKSADLAIVPQESPFYIPEETKIKKDDKKTPKELGDAIAKAGFKVVLYASTQSYDLKEKGIRDTLNFWKTNYPDIHTLGITDDIEGEQKDYYIYTQDGIKIAIINYSGFVGNSIPSKNKFMVNIISQKKIEETVKKLRPEVDCIIVCINWGEKYSLNPSKNQIIWAKLLAFYGVDIIIGNHPVYYQPVSYVKAENGNKALVFFSLGVFIGHNTKRPQALGAMASIVISKENGKTSISSYNLIPTINHIPHEIDGNKYSVYKLTDYNDQLGKSANKRFSMDKIIKNCERRMGAFAHCG